MIPPRLHCFRNAWRIEDAAIQVAPLNVTSPAVGTPEFGLVMEDVELLCLISTIPGKMYDSSHKIVPFKYQKRELRNDAVSAAKYAIFTVNELRRDKSSKGDVRF